MIKKKPREAHFTSSLHRQRRKRNLR